VDRMTWTQHAAVTLLAIFGGIALLLAGVGLYGVMSYAVAQSTRELGLRMALGANGPDLLRLVVSQGFSLTLTGVAFGAAAAFGLTRLMGDLLYKVSPRDPRAFAGALVVMTIAAAAACLLPAWRAMRIDPVRALRG
jgi:ABC-type antimicrobial peptide transport system permease subunit